MIYFVYYLGNNIPIKVVSMLAGWGNSRLITVQIVITVTSWSHI